MLLYNKPRHPMPNPRKDALPSAPDARARVEMEKIALQLDEVVWHVLREMRAR